MSPTGQDWATNRRRELNRERGSRRRLLALDAQRRLNASAADHGRIKAVLVGLADPRYAYLTHAHD